MAPSSPKEPRRSNRRSAPSTTTSKSSGSPSPENAPAPTLREPEPPAAVRTNSSNRAKRVKDEHDNGAEENRHRRNTSISSATVSTPTNNGGKRTKRKSGGKNSRSDLLSKPSDTPPEDVQEEEDDVTRCICGTAGDEEDWTDWMIQCENCKVWQHGPCMGFPTVDDVPQDNYEYFCEECKPQNHVELLRKHHKKQRQGSAHSHNAAQPGPSRSSRSHSPSYAIKPSKRRNTMNSRDAAYEENLCEALDASTVDAPTGEEGAVGVSVEPVREHDAPPEHTSANQPGRKKRKRSDDDGLNNKRKRSTSKTSDVAASAVAEPAEPQVTVSEPPTLPPPPKTTGRGKRGGGRKAMAEHASNADGDEVAGTSKRGPYANKSKPPVSSNGQHKRGPPSMTSQVSNNMGQEHVPRRGAGTPQGSNSNQGQGSGQRNTYSQNNAPMQPLLTSWGLPDYLAHLQSILPSEIPEPLVINGHPDQDSDNIMAERGVKVKWPAKRMSVVDMNKRVRAMVEWVGREQAGASERERRRVALEQAVVALGTSVNIPMEGSSTGPNEGSGGSGSNMDGVDTSALPPEVHALRTLSAEVTANEAARRSRLATVALMEELMEELINFQERFGPGAKGRTRERPSRTVAVS